MNVMSEADLEKVVNAKLAEAGLSDVIDRNKSQFLEIPPGFFSEIVLVDASRQSDAERTVQQVAHDLRADGTVLEYVVRSIWKVGAIRYLGPARTPEGGLRMALTFLAELKSGSQQVQIQIDVSIAALTVLRQKLGKDEWVMHIGWSPEKGDVQEKNISAAVAAFLEIQLSHGGTSYWDPLLYSRLEMNEAAMSYVLGHSAAFQELHTAITDAFSEDIVKTFVNDLSLSGIRLADFDQALSALSNMLGGAFRRGQRFSVSAHELYSSLTRGEQLLLKDYFRINSTKLKKTHPELAHQFPRQFEKLD